MSTSLAGTWWLVSFGVLGLMGLFGGDDESQNLERIANRLGANPNIESIERRIEDLSKAVDQLTTEADLRYYAQNPPKPDASCVEKAETLANEVQNGRINFETARSEDRTKGPIQSAAEEVRRDSHTSGEKSASLLSVLSNPEEPFPVIKKTLGNTVDRLDEYESTVSALEGAQEANPSEIEALFRNQPREDNELSRKIIELVDNVEPAARSEEIEEVFSLVCQEIESETEISISGDTPKAQGRSILNAIETGEIAVGEDSSGPSRIVETVRERTQPQSKLGRDLLEALESGDQDSLNRILVEVISELERLGTTRGMLTDVDRSEVMETTKTVLKTLESLSNPIGDVIADRVTKLEGSLNRADKTNDVIPYAVDQEVTFYKEQLIPKLIQFSSIEREDSEVPPDPDDILARKQELEQRHIESKQDHNHSIPLHFLSVVESLVDEEQQLVSSGDDSRARGIHHACLDLLDALEALYEKNEYSVMLRRLRS